MTIEMTTLGDLISLQRGYDLTETQRRPGSVPIVGSAGVHGHHDVARAKGPGVTLGRSGASFGKVTYIREDFWPHNTTIFVTNFKGNDPLFIRYLLESLDFSSLNSGAAQQSLNRNFIYPVAVRRFEHSLQRRIANFLVAYDDLVENSQRRIRILDEMARSLYREWFVDFRFPGHAELPRVDSSLGDIPQGWEIKSLETVCARITDGAHQSPASVNEGYPMASVKDMHDWGFSIENCRKISAADFDDLVRNSCKPLKDDVLIAKDGSYLKHTFVVGEELDLVILSSIAILRPNSEIQPNYLSFTLREPTTKARMTGFVSGVAIPRIVLKDFRKFQILVPPLNIQAAWSRHIDPMVEMCRKLISQIQNLRRTRDLLLPRLTSSSVSVKGIEVAA